jgi:hypothetical protein
MKSVLQLCSIFRQQVDVVAVAGILLYATLVSMRARCTKPQVTLMFWRPCCSHARWLRHLLLLLLLHTHAAVQQHGRV